MACACICRLLSSTRIVRRVIMILFIRLLSSPRPEALVYDYLIIQIAQYCVSVFVELLDSFPLPPLPLFPVLPFPVFL